ncbi:MAG: DUF4174 domain-containing protein [Cytophagaceae bacterium]|nr:DUF4174 domain-containing protein [Cytophagaceae bacterium]
MKTYYSLIPAWLVAVAGIPCLFAMTFQQADPVLKKYQWKSRVLLVFAPVEESPDFLKQRNIDQQAREGYGERDLVVLELFQREGREVGGTALTRPQVDALRKQFGVKTDGFTVILLGKDGGEKLRQTRPLLSEELFRLIDSMPMRQGEMRRQ